MDAEVDAHRQAIEVAKAESSETSPTDVLRLDTELRALQDLHGWRLVRASPLVMVYNSELELSISTNGASLALASEPDALSTALLRITQLALAPLASSPVADLVRATGQLWTAVRHMRSELNTLALYYPVSYLDYEDGFAATATVVLPHFRAKAHLQFAIGPESLTAWPAPAAMAAVKVAAEVVYGKVE